MIYNQIKKLLFPVNKLLATRLIGLFLFFFLQISNLTAQEFKAEYKNIPLSNVLINISNKYNIKIAFDAQKLSEIPINIESTQDYIDEILDEILFNTGYTYKLKHKTYIILPIPEIDDRERYSFIGLVSDASSGERLPSATVIFPQIPFSVSSSVDGTFSVTDNINQELHIKLSYIGYYPIDTIIHLTKKTATHHLKLKQKSYTLSSIFVKADKLQIIKTGDQAGHITINPQKFSDLPNISERDVFKTLQLLPGISYSENSSELNIRGGTADQNLVLFDGFTLYNLDHLFGFFSALNTNVIKDIQVYRGGFESIYGERISGVVDITGKTGNTQNFKMNAALNLLSANLSVEIPITKKITIIAAGRRAYTDIYPFYLSNDYIERTFPVNNRENVTSSVTPDFYFYDYNFKVGFRISEKENLTISAYGGKDFMDNPNVMNDKTLTIDTKDNNQWYNYGYGIKWTKQINEKNFLKFQTGYSGYSNKYNNYTVITRNNQPLGQEDYLPKIQNMFENNEENRLVDYSVSLSNTNIINKRNTLDYGISIKKSEFNYTKDLEKTTYYNDLNNSSLIGAIFIQNNFRTSKGLTITPGIRFSYFENTSKAYPEPRLAINYKLNKNILLKFATGRYCQFISKASYQDGYGYNRDIWTISDNEKHPVLSSEHYILGFGLDKSGFYLDVEAYYKTISGLQEYLYKSQFLKNNDFNGQGEFVKQPNAPMSYFASGIGKAYGIDFLVKYETGNFTSWIAYSLSKAVNQFPLINNNSEIPAPTNKTHDFKFVNMLSYKKWNFSAVYIFSDGNSYVTSTKTKQQFTTNREYSTLPAYHSLNLSANFNFNLNKVKIKLGTSLINALNRNNYFDIYQREFDFENTTFGQTTLVKGNSITPNFFINVSF